MRVWLQSSSLLAVVAGYSLLFAVSRGFVEAGRLDRHQQLVASLSEGLRDGRVTLPLPPGLGVEAQWIQTRPVDPAQTIRSADGRVWLISRTPLDAPSQQASVLEVRQDITTSVARSQRDLLLLIAVAGGSVLFTSALLRLVIWRGLIQPLRGFACELEQLEADSLGIQALNPAQQPSELLPIVQAFNQLQLRLAAAWQRERRFVDGVAHELRTPITLISGRSQRLLRKPHVPEQEPALAQIADEASRMAALISALLELARSDAGRLEIQRHAVDPEQVVLDAFERLQPLAPQRLQLAPAGAHALPVIEADPERLHQCLLALVDNALAYSSGPVQLACSRDRSPEAVWVTLHVLDQGPGIPAKERTAVLERFARGSTASGTRGSGIGLAVVDELSRAMGAELVIAERRGGGADLQLRFRV
ncbi:MAG: hypothetical protein RLZZ216_959 [Cyanobacteriota bacterium]